MQSDVMDLEFLFEFLEFNHKKIWIQRGPYRRRKRCKTFDFLGVWYQSVKLKFDPAKFLTNCSYGCQIFSFLFSESKFCFCRWLEDKMAHWRKKTAMTWSVFVSRLKRDIFCVARLDGQINLNLKLVAYIID